MLRPSLLAAAALALAACATTEASDQASSQRDCFLADQVSGYDTIDDHHIAITVSPRRRYILTTGFNARDLNWSMALLIRSRNNWICTGNGLGVELVGGEPQRSYPINNIARAPDPEPAVQGS